MDSDFQAHYLTAEQAYGVGDFRTAQSITVDLLSQLDGTAETNTDRDALLAWRAFVALLAGNIHLYGLNEPDRARGFYELVLASNPQDTLKDLAEQGLERIQTRRGHGDEVVDPAPATSPPRCTLIQDPFLAQPSAGGFTAGLGSQHDASQASATPWLDGPAATARDITATQAQNPVSTAPVAIKEAMAKEVETDAVAEAEADAEPSPAVQVQADPEPEEVIEAEVIPEPEPEREPQPEPTPNPELVVSPSIRQRLEQGRLQVNLPAQHKPLSELSSDRGKDSSLWSWLRARLSRG